MEHLERKEAICRELLDLLWLLRTGKSKMRGLLLYELYLCVREKQRRGLQTYEAEINNNVMMISVSLPLLCVCHIYSRFWDDKSVLCHRAIRQTQLL